MAKRAPKPQKTPGARTTRALEHGSRAAGASQKKSGFCFTAEDDLAFALGFPHLRYLVDDEQDPRAEAERLIFHAVPERLEFGRDAALRFVRVLCLRAISDSQRAEPTLLPESLAALGEGGPLGEGEARERMLHLFRGESILPPHAPTAFLLMEALMGPDFVSGVILEGLEGIEVGRWIAYAESQKSTVDTLGVMSLRLEPRARDEVFARLRALKARLLEEAARGFDVDAAVRELAAPKPPVPVRNGVIDHSSPAWAVFERDRDRRRALEARVDFVRTGANNCGLDIVDGSATVDLWRPIVRAAPDAVRDARLAKREPVMLIPDPRAVFVGGDDVYRVEVELWSKYRLVAPAEAHPLILERFGRIRSPLSVELALDMSVRSRAKAQAKQWLKDHAEYAAPILADLARSSSRLAEAAAKLSAPSRTAS